MMKEIILSFFSISRYCQVKICKSTTSSTVVPIISTSKFTPTPNVPVSTQITVTQKVTPIAFSVPKVFETLKPTLATTQPSLITPLVTESLTVSPTSLAPPKSTIPTTAPPVLEVPTLPFPVPTTHVPSTTTTNTVSTLFTTKITSKSTTLAPSPATQTLPKSTGLPSTVQIEQSSTSPTLMELSTFDNNSNLTLDTPTQSTM